VADLVYPIDWQAGVVERWRFLSAVAVAWDGGEQRQTLREVPRVEFEAELFASGANAAGLAAWLEAHQAESFLMPYWPAGESAVPALEARFLEPVEMRWPTPTLARAQAKTRLVEGLPVPAAEVPQSGGLDYLPTPAPDFREPLPDSWRRLLEVLDYQTGPIRVTDRSGYVRRRFGLDYLLIGDEIAVARTFLWRRYGRVKPALFPAPAGGWVLARLDADDIEWRWITPQCCRVAVGVLTLPNEA
jgi:hypothetical protein